MIEKKIFFEKKFFQHFLEKKNFVGEKSEKKFFFRENSEKNLFFGNKFFSLKKTVLGNSRTLLKSSRSLRTAAEAQSCNF